MIAILVIAVVLAIYTGRSLRQKRVASNLIKKGGIAIYSVETETSLKQQLIASEGDFWRHFFYPIDMVVLQPTVEFPGCVSCSFGPEVQLTSNPRSRLLEAVLRTMELTF
jgi:hypothetical protein